MSNFPFFSNIKAFENESSFYKNFEIVFCKANLRKLINMIIFNRLQMHIFAKYHTKIEYSILSNDFIRLA